jgi:hypothetical protein
MAWTFSIFTSSVKPHRDPVRLAQRDGVADALLALCEETGCRGVRRRTGPGLRSGRESVTGRRRPQRFFTHATVPYRTAAISAATLSTFAVMGTSHPEPRMKPPSCPMDSMSSPQ